jgi:hypothetical protein
LLLIGKFGFAVIFRVLRETVEIIDVDECWNKGGGYIE